LISGDGNQTLFDGAILLSGGPLLIADNLTTIQPKVSRIFSRFNCSTIECLQRVNAEALLLATSLEMFGPIVDGAYLKLQALDAFAAKKLSRVPLLVNTNKDEGLTFTREVTDESSYLQFIKLRFPWLSTEGVRELNDVYSSDKYRSRYLQSADEFADLLFQCPALEIANAYSANGVRVGKTNFDHVPAIPLASYLVGLGAYHGV
jgi:carboxylesterase type B